MASRGPWHHGVMSGLVVVAFIVVGVAVIAAVVLALLGRWSPEGLPDAPPERAEPALDRVPVGEVTAADIAEVRLDQAVRGYRMDEVDAVIGRLTAEIVERDRLLGRTGADPAAPQEPGEGEPAAGPDAGPDAGPADSGR